MRKKIGMMAALAEMLAGEGSKEAVYIFDRTSPLLMQGVTFSSNPADFGIYRAGAKAHKQFLRKNYLGKFRKGR